MASFQRLHHPGDIRAVFAARRSAHAAAFSLHVADHGVDQAGRCTVVAGRKVGSAVQRNRAKRRLRAALAGLDAPPGVDVVVVARTAALTEDFASLQAQLERTLRRAIHGAAAA